jgi:hypothetical protein
VVLLIVNVALAAASTITPGPRYRSGELKAADFPHFYVPGEIAAAGRAEILYDAPARHARQVSLVPATRLQLSVPLLLAWLWELHRVSFEADGSRGGGAAGGKLGSMRQGSPRWR